MVITVLGAVTSEAQQFCRAVSLKQLARRFYFDISAPSRDLDVYHRAMAAPRCARSIWGPAKRVKVSFARKSSGKVIANVC
jgi:hypothetical protein